MFGLCVAVGQGFECGLFSWPAFGRGMKRTGFERLRGVKAIRDSDFMSDVSARQVVNTQSSLQRWGCCCGVRGSTSSFLGSCWGWVLL